MHANCTSHNDVKLYFRAGQMMCINTYVNTLCGSTKCRTNMHDNFSGHNDVKSYLRTRKMTNLVSQYVNR